ncbi:MAG: hypothetical protein ACFFB5_06725 [Promethearchaeota archaeon]
MRKHYQTYFVPILLFFMLNLPNSNIISESTLQMPTTNINDDYPLQNPSLKHLQTFDLNKTILPNTNLTISSYIEYEQGTTAFQDSFNATVLSLNRTHWFIHFDYSIPTLDKPSFDSIVNRTSTNHGYEATNYWEIIFGNPSHSLDFWIDTTGFFDKYQFTVDTYTVTVLADTIKMAQVDQEFKAWKIAAGILTFWYAADSGLLLCLKEDLGPNIIWFNLTKAEIAQPPPDYKGPYIMQASHINNSRLASNTIISLEFTSPYGTDVIYYHWDDDNNLTTSSNFFNVILPGEDGSHEIFIIAFDNVGFHDYYHLVYITDNTLPGISLLTPRNNSKIKGTTEIQLFISSGNGTIVYQWDGGNFESVDENTYIPVPNPELEISHILNVSVKSPISGLWVNARYIWIVDNSPPEITYDFVNNSVIKGDVEIIITSSEDINLTYRLLNMNIKSIFIETLQNHTIRYSNLENGSYILLIYATDEAQNIASTRISFSIYISAFDWNWEIKANSPRTIRFKNASNDLWFILTLTSSIDQFFNLSVISKDSLPENAVYAIEFNCEKSDEIIFITLTLMLSSNASEFPVYQWKRWDNQSSQWLNITTVYNEVSNSWEATYESYVPYFALINTGRMTNIKSIIPGGGEIPSFEIIPALLSLISLCFVINRKKRKFS